MVWTLLFFNIENDIFIIIVVFLGVNGPLWSCVMDFVNHDLKPNKHTLTLKTYTENNFI